MAARKPASPARRPVKAPVKKAVPAKKAPVKPKAPAVPMQRQAVEALTRWCLLTLAQKPVPNMETPQAKFALAKKWVNAKGIVTQEGFRVAISFLIRNQAK